MKRAEAIQIWEAINGGPYDYRNKTDRAALFLIFRNPGERSLSATASKVGIGLPEARKLERAAIKNGIFVDGNICADWLDPERGAISFMLDAMCLAGLLQRTGDPQ